MSNASEPVPYSDLAPWPERVNVALSDEWVEARRRWASAHFAEVTKNIEWNAENPSEKPREPNVPSSRHLDDSQWLATLDAIQSRLDAATSRAERAEGLTDSLCALLDEAGDWIDPWKVGYPVGLGKRIDAALSAAKGEGAT